MSTATKEIEIFLSRDAGDSSRPHESVNGADAYLSPYAVPVGVTFAKHREGHLVVSFQYQSTEESCAPAPLDDGVPAVKVVRAVHTSKIQLLITTGDISRETVSALAARVEAAGATQRLAGRLSHKLVAEILTQIASDMTHDRLS